MLQETLQRLSAKHVLDGDDAFTLLQLLQDHATPILSLRSVSSSPATSSCRQPASSGRTKTSRLAIERRSTCVGKSGDGSKGSGNRSVKGRGGEGEGIRTPELVEEESCRSTSLGVSSNRALFGPPQEHINGQAVTAADTAAVLNFSSLEEFPPMQSAATITARKKERRTSKPRRITLTSVQHQSPTSHAALFTSPPPTSDSWSSPHPAFAVEATTCEAPSPLSEERRLLRKERSRHRRRSGGVGRSGGQCGQSSFQISQTNNAYCVTTRVQSLSSVNQSGLAGVSPRCVSPSASPLDSDGDQPLTLTTSSTGHRVERNIIELHALPQPADDSTPLISTPRPHNTPSTVARYAVSIDRISNRNMLDQFANLYSKIITGRLVPNITSEIHFVVQLLTCTQPASQTHSKSRPEFLFDRVENCVYFAVRVLYDMKSVLTALDKATVQLLSENIRINQLEPRLSVFLTGALDTVQNEVSRERRPQSQSLFTRVPFQEGSDNIKNFPNMKVFHAFKKQRDSFYSILRDWETHHNSPNWNFQSALQDKIRLLMSQPPELCSLDHLASLFQKQLLESCGYVAYVSAGVGGLEGPLKNLNPDKLMRLSERFLRQSRVSTGTCPPPSFSESEQFFSTFILTADSYIFNHCLSTVLHHELLKLHARCTSVEARDVPEVLHALRVLAKFLGYLDFLPYSRVPSSSLLPARTAPANIAMVSGCVCEAGERHHLCLTIPWVVDYTSMLDSHALQITQCRTLLYQLMTVYRSALSERESIATDTFLVLTCLGWLFEIPNVPNSVFFEFMKTYPTPDPSPALSSHTDTQTALVTRELLYICCPYLAGIRVILAEFAAGLQLKTSPIRKIKPIPAETDTPHIHITTHSQLQMRLQENFFRSHPPYLKQLCGSISERVADTGILLVQSQVIPAHTTRGLRVLADWITKTCSEHLSPDSSVNIEELFHKSEAIQTVAQVSEQTITSVLREATQFCKQHCATNTQKAISSLLCDTISEQVMAVAVGIATDWAVHHCMKWTHSKLRDIVFQEVQGGFDRLRKAVRAGGNAHRSALSLNTSSGGNAHRSALSLNTSSGGKAHCSALSLNTSSGGNAHRSALSLNTSSGGKAHCSALSLNTSSGGNAHRSTLSLNTSSPSPHHLPSPPVSHASTPPTSNHMLLQSTPSKSQSVFERHGDSRTQCPLTHFMELASSALKNRDMCPLTDRVQGITAATAGVKEFIASQVVVVDGGNSPLLLPRKVDTLLSTSVHLAALLVSHDLLRDSRDCSREGPSFVTEIVSLWSFLKGLKQEVPIHILLNSESVTHYLQPEEKGGEGVWCSLTCLLLESIRLSVVTTDVIEALWLCRIKQAPAHQRRSVISGGGIFLTAWYGKEDKCETGHGVFREACFVRLLSAVLRESDCPCIASLRSHPSLPFLTL